MWVKEESVRIKRWNPRRNLLNLCMVSARHVCRLGLVYHVRILSLNADLDFWMVLYERILRRNRRYDCASSCDAMLLHHRRHAHAMTFLCSYIHAAIAHRIPIWWNYRSFRWVAHRTEALIGAFFFVAWCMHGQHRWRRCTLAVVVFTVNPCFNLTVDTTMHV